VRRLLLLAILAACAIPIATCSNLVFLAPAIMVIVLVDSIALWLFHESDLGKALGAAVCVVLVMVAFTTSFVVTGFNRQTIQIAEVVFTHNALANLVKGRLLHDACIYMAGMLLASFELHYLITWVIKSLRITPESTPDQSARGRIIGLLERPIVFILIITGNFVSLGLVFSAKTLSRFGNLSERNFAEYYLIGTLLSFGTTALLAGLLSLAIA
jgi:hypothetical protein